MQRYLDRILKSVSRSFYLSLKILPPDVRTPMGLGYLLCRLADTIADTTVLPYDQREKFLNKYNSIFEHVPTDKNQATTLKKELLESLTEIPSDEKFLVENIEPCLNALRGTSRTDQVFIHEVVQGVIKGMMIDLKAFGETSKTLRGLKSVQDLEDYIKWIGGEPGRFWTKLTLHYFPHLNISDREKLINQGIDFGKGLQMINILRDIPEDLQNGRCYIPEQKLIENSLSVNSLLDPSTIHQFLPIYHQLIDDTLDRLKQGLSYIQSLPKSEFRLRASIWWPLAIALKTLGKLRRSQDVLNPEVRVKITRGEIYRVIVFSGLLLFSKRLMRTEFEDLAEAARSRMSYN